MKTTMKFSHTLVCGMDGWTCAYLSFPHLPHILQNIIESVQLLGRVGWSRVLRYEDKLLYGWFGGLNIHICHTRCLPHGASWQLTCLWGSEADDKRLSGEGVHVSGAIIRGLILSCDCHHVRPEHANIMSTHEAAGRAEHGAASPHLYTNTYCSW